MKTLIFLLFLVSACKPCEPCSSGVSICERTEKVRDAIVAKVADITDCNDINYYHLDDITELDLSGSYDPAGSVPCNDLNLKSKDFYGLINLESLDLSGNCLESLENYRESDGFFKDLNSIQTINLHKTGIEKLSKNFFNGVLDTLNNEGITVDTFFYYCNDPVSPYKDKLDLLYGEIKAHNDPGYSKFDMSKYCY